jgi:hypothetical protein
MKIMMKKMGADVGKMDESVLDEIIAKAEDAMVRPFQKKKSVAVVDVQPEKEEPEEMESEGISSDDLEDLMELYNKIVGK